MNDLKALTLMDILVHSFGKSSGRLMSPRHPQLLLAWCVQGRTQRGLEQAIAEAIFQGWLTWNGGDVQVTQAGEEAPEP